MPFFQSMGVRFGVQNILENCGVDKETAGWVAAGASLTTALVTADLHGHLAGEAVAHGVHHGASHVASHGSSHIVSQSSDYANNHMAYSGHDTSYLHSDHADLQRSGISHYEFNHSCEVGDVVNYDQGAGVHHNCEILDIDHTHDQVKIRIGDRWGQEGVCWVPISQISYS